MLSSAELNALPDPQFGPISSSQLMLDALAHKFVGVDQQGKQSIRFRRSPVALTEHSVMIAVNGAVNDTFGLRIEMEDMISIRIALDGDFVFRLQAPHIEQYEGARVSLLHFPGEHYFDSWYLANRHYQLVHIGIPYQDLISLFKIDPLKLDDSVVAYFQGKASRALFQSFALSAQFAELASEIMHCRYEGESEIIYLRAKGMEILCEIVEMLHHPPQMSLSAKTREENQLILAKQILEQNFISPPSLAQIANKIGMSRARLTRRFRQKYDCSLMQYAQTLRLNQAQQMLKSGRYSVTETALETGYQSASNFARSYQKHFGHAPKADKGILGPA